MSLMNDLNLGGPVNPDDDERKLAGGGLPPVGVHHAVFDGYKEVTANTGTRGHEMAFKIVAGPGKGKKVKHTAWCSKDGATAEAKADTETRFRVMSLRLGLLKKDKGKYAMADGKAGFADCFGNACFIDVVHETRDWQPEKGPKRTITDARLNSFNPVLDPADPKCKAVAKASPDDLKAQADQAPPPPPKPAGDDFGDI